MYRFTDKYIIYKYKAYLNTWNMPRLQCTCHYYLHSSELVWMCALLCLSNLSFSCISIWLDIGQAPKWPHPHSIRTHYELVLVLDIVCTWYMISYSGCHLISIAFYQTGFSNVYIKLIEAHVVFLRVRIQINKTGSIRFSGSMRLHNIDCFVSSNISTRCRIS